MQNIILPPAIEQVLSTTIPQMAFLFANTFSKTSKSIQDTAADATDHGTKAQADKDDGTYYPWDDLPLPSFFDQLPAHNQELIRRARQGNRDAKHSVWDRKTNEWVKWEKAKAMGLVGNVMKSRHLNNVDADTGENEEDEADEDDEDEEMIDGPNPGAAAKKRKITSRILGEDRTFEVRKWVAVPADKADKMTEPKYLADRRPGMPSLYTNAAVLKQASGYGAPVTAVNEYSGFDLGDGSGLGNAMGGAAAAAPGEATPVRKNMPPKRKKKKLGGPGRRKAVPVESAGQTAATESKEGETAEKPAIEGEKKEGDVEGEGEGEGEEGTGDESEGEGSEEGEVNEEPVPAAPVTVPQVTVEAVVEEIPAVSTPEPFSDMQPGVLPNFFSVDEFRVPRSVLRESRLYRPPRLLLPSLPFLSLLPAKRRQLRQSLKQSLKQSLRRKPLPLPLSLLLLHLRRRKARQICLAVWRQPWRNRSECTTVRNDTPPKQAVNNVLSARNDDQLALLTAFPADAIHANLTHY